MPEITYEKFEENISTATKLFTDSAMAMTDLYNRQFQQGLSILTGIFSNGSSAKNLRQTPDPLSLDTMHVQKNVQEFTENTMKTMAALFGSYNKQFTGSYETTQWTNYTISVLNLQAKYLNELNQQFLNSWYSGNKITGKDMDEINDLFRENMEKNLKMAEEQTERTAKTFSFIAEKSGRDANERLENLNRQMEQVTNSSLNLWSDMMQLSLKEGQPDSKTRSSESKRKNKK